MTKEGYLWIICRALKYNVCIDVEQRRSALIKQDVFLYTGYAMKAFIALENGTIFEGVSFGAAGERLGEVVFNTSMISYQETAYFVLDLGNKIIDNYNRC